MDTLLKEFEESLKKNFKDVHETLQPGSSSVQLEVLKEIFYPDAKIPSALEELYRWHNGQDEPYSFNQNDNRTFLSIEEAINAWEFLNDPMEDIQEPISKSWLPLTYNGAGDYLVYETRGEHTGKIIAFWHDDENRDVVYNSIQQWITAALNSTKPPLAD